MTLAPEVSPVGGVAWSAATDPGGATHPAGRSEEVDAVVIGLGPGGETLAGQLARAGLSVVGVEAELVGGECPYWACNPSKMMIRAAGTLAEARRVGQLAGEATVRPEWAPVARRVRQEATSDWDDTAAVERLARAGVQVVRGRARLAGPGQVAVDDGRSFHARRAVVLATGSAPVVPPVDGLADTPYWTSRAAIAATEPPASMIVLGGGTVGVELAQVYARFGTAVTVVEVHDRLLSREEPEVGPVAAHALAADGATVHAGVTVRSVRYDAAADGFVLDCGDDAEVRGQRLLVATGRRPVLGGLGLETVGAQLSGGVVATDGRLRAGQRLWAVGDVTGHGMYTHVATYQAGVAARDILATTGPPADYRAVPRVTFTDPEVGAVGLTEAQARSAGVAVATGWAWVPETARGWIHGPGNEGFVKLVADRHRGVLVGATMVAPAAGEAIGALAVAVHAAVPYESLRHLMYAYPTFHRGIDAALGQLPEAMG